MRATKTLVVLVCQTATAVPVNVRMVAIREMTFAPYLQSSHFRAARLMYSMYLSLCHLLEAEHADWNIVRTCLRGSTTNQSVRVLTYHGNSGGGQADTRLLC